MLTIEQKKLHKAWLAILSILKETGYDFMYEDEITLVAKVIRKELGLD